MPDFGGKTHKNQLEMQIVILIQSKVSQLKGKQLENAKCAPWVNSCELCFGKLRLLKKFLNARLRTCWISKQCFIRLYMQPRLASLCLFTYRLKLPFFATPSG